MKQESEANADADKKAKEQVDKLNSADQMIFQTEKQLEEFGDKLSEDKKKPIETALEALKKAYETKELEQIEPEEMYKAQAEAGSQADPAAGAKQPNDAGKSASGDDVQDVDFEEVK